MKIKKTLTEGTGGSTETNETDGRHWGLHNELGLGHVTVDIFYLLVPAV